MHTVSDLSDRMVALVGELAQAPRGTVMHASVELRMIAIDPQQPRAERKIAAALAAAVLVILNPSLRHE